MLTGDTTMHLGSSYEARSVNIKKFRETLGKER